MHTWLPLLALSACTAPSAGGPSVTRTYYLAADEVEWNYAPGDTNRITGQPWSPLDKEFVETRGDRIGKVYRKVVFREYTDSNFATLATRPPEWEHLGMLGPLLRGVVGDTIRVVFRNNATHPHTVHPHGVIYNKDSEGAPYSDGTSGADRADDGVPPGGTHVYLWPIPDRAGPGPMEGSSVFWMYHSHADEAADLNSGLIGPIVVTARGRTRPDGTPNDVDRELVVLFGEIDENFSHYHQENVNRYALAPASVPQRATFSDPYYLANLRETMNGRSYGYVSGLRMRVGERVRWYVFGSTNFEIHAPHWHGQTALANHMRTDVLSLMTMQMVVADMVPDNPGTWLFHCHVAPHQLAGMAGLFTVTSDD